MYTVVIPLFNKETYIGTTLDSVLNQSFKEFEVIIVNDGSIDASFSIVSQIEDPRIKIISIKNSGVSVARNTGVENAKFDWIAFLDADDWWAPTFLEEVTGAMAAFPNRSLFASGRSRVFKTEVERYAHKLLPTDGTTKEVNYFEVIQKYLPLVNSSNVVIKKLLFEEKGYFRKGQKKHEDHDLWMRLAVNNPVVFINKELSFYRKTEMNTESSQKYDASDFACYLNTLLEVRNSISDMERRYFKRYCDNFILLTYIKNYGYYSKNEDTLVYQLAIQLVEGQKKTLLQLLKIIPYKKTYPFFKLLHR